MNTVRIDPSQRTAARVVGFCYVLALIPAVFAEFYVLNRLVDSSNAAVTAQNIMAHERLFRLGIASNLIVFSMDIALITALYVVLERVNRNLALFAAFSRLMETALLFVAALMDFQVLRALSGAEYLRAFEPVQLAALARLWIGAHGNVYNVALMVFGIGSTVFGYLWLKSGYIPKALAILGIAASAWVGAWALAFVVFPEWAKVVTIMYYGMPIFLFELTLGLWMLFRGLRPSGVAELEKAAGPAFSRP
jgi:hypothetical protein